MDMFNNKNKPTNISKNVDYYLFEGSNGQKLSIKQLWKLFFHDKYGKLMSNKKKNHLSRENLILGLYHLKHIEGFKMI